MKRFIYLFLFIIVCITLVSWGFKGHKAVATIAENHLNKNAKDVVNMMLDNHSMDEVASWADEVRSEQAYKYTAPWHFLNLPLGLSRQEFEQRIKSQQDVNNIYAAILWCELKLSSIPKNQNDASKRQEALKFLIHLVGDAHQPMHISRAEDRGGNTIQVRFDDKGTNLHSLWDSKLIDHEGLSDKQIAKEYDTATPEQIKAWQNDDPLQWLWESYQISSKLYSEVERTNKLDDEYYRLHIGLVHQRIEQAGIRLAGILNKIYSSAQVKVKVTHVTLTPPPPVETPDSTAAVVELKDLPNMIGKQVVVEGKVYGIKDVGSMILVNLGAPYPNQLATVVLRGKARSLGATLANKTILVMGTVVEYKGKPEIVITEPDELSVK